jgi:hypothetical protein
MRVSGFTFVRNGTILGYPFMDPPSWDTLRHRFGTASRWMAVATAFSLVVSTALCTVTMVLFLAFWIASSHYREKLSQIQARPLAL